jgi:hypothetical protein
MRRLTFILLIVLLTACGGKEDKKTPTSTPSAPLATPLPTQLPTPTAMAAPQVDTNPLTRAQLRVVQVNPHLPPVNLYLDGGEIGRGFTLGNYHDTPISINAGTYLLRVVPAGDNPDTTTPLLSQRIELNSGQSLIAVLTGSADAPEIILAQEQLETLPANTARLSVIHAIPRGLMFNLKEANLNVVQEVDYGMTGGPVEIQSGKHPLTFESGPQTLTTFNLNAVEKYVYTVILYADAGGDYKTLTFRSRVNDETRIRVVQASPNLSPVDIYLDDTLLGGDLSYRGTTDWTSFPSLRYQLSIKPAGVADAEPLVQQQVALSPDQATTFVLLGTSDRLRIEDADEDLSATAPDQTRFTFVQAANGVSQAKIQTLGGAVPDVAPVSFGASVQLANYPAGAEGFVFTTGEGDTVRDIDLLTERAWNAGMAYLIVITGYPNQEPLVLETSVGTTEVVALAAQPTTGLYQIRLVHALPDAAPISLAEDGLPIFDDVSPGTSTTYHVFDQKPQHFTVVNSDSDALLLDTDIPIPDATQPVKYTLFIYRDQGDARFFMAFDSDFLLGDGQARLRIFHAAANQPSVRIVRTAAPPVLAEGADQPAVETATPLPDEPLSDTVDFGETNEPRVILARASAVRVLDATTDQVLVSIPAITFESKGFYDLLLLPDASGLGLVPVLIAHTD